MAQRSHLFPPLHFCSYSPLTLLRLARSIRAKPPNPDAASEADIIEAISEDLPNGNAGAGTKRKAGESIAGSNAKRMQWENNFDAQLDLIELVAEFTPHLQGHGKIGPAWAQLTERMK